jgi:ATP-dependent helicase/nuclease subunit A
MECVNRLFQHPDMQGLLEDFQPHTTHREDYWGRLEVWPLIEVPDPRVEPQPGGGLRNPLRQPRPYYRDRRHYREGEAIAGRIQELVQEGHAAYNDILILMRSRTHLAEYEAALRDRGVPYLSLDRGTLLQSLEIRDLEALLVVLMTPQDNLSVAQILRSPVFSASDTDLMLLAAEKTGSWYERLQDVGERLEADHPLARAARLLGEWHALAGRIPIHDLLEHIFHQANLTARFCAAFPATERARVRANLTRFVELALEVDAGRYPSLPRFLERLRQLRSLDREGPSQATPQSADSQRVRLLTIHAAKGLEAPVVFLADSARETAGNQGSSTLVRWPAEAERPTDFLLLGNRRQRDSISQRSYELEQQEERREAANLLYVALTRARHMLVISGCTSARQAREPAWYQQVATALCGGRAPAARWVETRGTPPRKQTGQPQAPPGRVDARLRGRITVPSLWREIAPSRSVGDDEAQGGEADGALRGRVVHRLLQLAADQPQPGAMKTAILMQVANEHRLGPDDPRLETWWQEVMGILTDTGLAWLMRPGTGFRCYNEVPVQFRKDGRTVFGIIDRLIAGASDVYIVDYKTHRLNATSDADGLADHYLPQMALYREAVQRLWPDRRVSSYLLFTSACHLVDIP